MATRTGKSLPGFAAPSVGFDEPFEMLSACHDRLRRSLLLLVQLLGHVSKRGIDGQASTAASDVLRYFNVAAPAHHEDEEKHVVPMLHLSEDAELRALGSRILADHELLRAAWAALAPHLEHIRDGTIPAVRDFAKTVDRFVGLHDDHLRLEDQIAFPHARVAQGKRGERALAAMGQEMSARRGASSKKG